MRRSFEAERRTVSEEAAAEAAVPKVDDRQMSGTYET